MSEVALVGRKASSQEAVPYASLFKAIVQGRSEMLKDTGSIGNGCGSCDAARPLANLPQPPLLLIIDQRPMKAPAFPAASQLGDP
ncbi:MAG: hypothetical protein J6Q41_00220 [Firmicutes bacterium]|nr:hypothetical protein [Bacillota bacterium]